MSWALYVWLGYICVSGAFTLTAIYADSKRPGNLPYNSNAERSFVYLGYGLLWPVWLLEKKP